MNHMPWDNGAIRDMFEPLGVTNKTVKTRCGIRARLAAADHRQEITCAACKSDMQREAEAHKAIMQYEREHGFALAGRGCGD